LHCAFVRVPVAHPPGLALETLLRERVLVALPSSNRLLRGRRRSLTLRALRDEPFILVRQSGAPRLYANLLVLCERHGFTPLVAHEVAQMIVALSLVAAGEGVAVVPASMAGTHPHAVAFRALEGASSISAPLTLIYRKADCHGALRIVCRRRAGNSAPNERTQKRGHGAISAHALTWALRQ
jgi:DNA-binding transcriptional LysR family regulator